MVSNMILKALERDNTTLLFVFEKFKPKISNNCFLFTKRTTKMSLNILISLFVFKISVIKGCEKFLDNTFVYFLFHIKWHLYNIILM